ncbi:hypothetical protein LCGC14_1614880 [marine sediment metagenome]|uniref:Uncharacterized protein n=1 Tax=marine sediment metagenome TaxID=412755 RepID=A0A0F9I7E7_9ZZZZ
MAVINEGRLRLSLIDYDGQKRQFSFDATVLTAANIAAQIITHDNLIAAIMDVTLGTKDFEEMVADRESIRPAVLAAAASAQVNVEWVVTYVDDVTTEVSNVRVPTADITDTALFAVNSNLWNPLDAKWVTFKAAFEAHVLSPSGNSVTLQQVALLQ